MTAADNDFDTRMRALWHAAGTHLDARSRQRLAPDIAIAAARARAGAAHTAPPRGRWLALASLASLALVAGLWLARPELSGSAPATAPVASNASNAAEAEDGLLAHTPDFYAWLASDEVQALAME